MWSYVAGFFHLTRCLVSLCCSIYFILFCACLSTHQLMNAWIVSSSWLLWRMLLLLVFKQIWQWWLLFAEAKIIKIITECGEGGCTLISIIRCENWEQGSVNRKEKNIWLIVVSKIFLFSWKSTNQKYYLNKY